MLDSELVTEANTIAFALPPVRSGAARAYVQTLRDELESGKEAWSARARKALREFIIRERGNMEASRA